MKTSVAMLAAAVLLMSAPSPLSSAELPLLTQRDAAIAALQASDWPKAEKLCGQLTELNPASGAHWYNLGLALMKQGKHAEAISAFYHSASTGRRPEECLYNVACALALAGNTDSALAAFQAAYAMGYINDELVRNDEDLKSLHNQPRFRKTAGWPVEGVTDRVKKWESDLEYLARRFGELHWRPYHQLTKAQFDSALAAIRRAVPASTDLQLRYEIQSLLVKVGDGHTTVVPDYYLLHHGSPQSDLQFLPIELFLFDDGPRITGATEDLKHLVGARVLAIGDLNIDAAVNAVDRYVARDNKWGALAGQAMALTDISQLTLLGAGTSKTGFKFKLELATGETQTIVVSQRGPEALHRISLDEVSGAPLSPSFKKPDEPLYLETSGHSLYARIDLIGDTHAESFADFTRRIFATGETSDARQLIIDLRNCPGGQGDLTAPLFHGLIASVRFNKPRSLYVLVGRKTFSAAMALAAQLDMHTEALFVGEPTGSCPNFVGETSVIRLPYSGLQISISSRYHQNGGSNDKRFWIPPDLPAPPSYADWRAGKDSALRMLLEN